VDNLWLKILVGGLQRAENQCWCGLSANPFGYNEVPTSSCQTFVGRHVASSTCLFFAYRRAVSPRLTSLREVSVRRNG
jgi:hypothetical protein